MDCDRAHSSGDKLRRRGMRAGDVLEAKKVIGGG